MLFQPDRLLLRDLRLDDLLDFLLILAPHEPVLPLLPVVPLRVLVMTPLELAFELVIDRETTLAEVHLSLVIGCGCSLPVEFVHRKDVLTAIRLVLEQSASNGVVRVKPRQVSAPLALHQLSDRVQTSSLNFLRQLLALMHARCEDLIVQRALRLVARLFVVEFLEAELFNELLAVFQV